MEPDAQETKVFNLRLYKSHFNVETYVNLDFQQLLTIKCIFKQSKANQKDWNKMRTHFPLTEVDRWGRSGQPCDWLY